MDYYDGTIDIKSFDKILLELHDLGKGKTSEEFNELLYERISDIRLYILDLDYDKLAGFSTQILDLFPDCFYKSVLLQQITGLFYDIIREKDEVIKEGVKYRNKVAELLDKLQEDQ